jgi:hypothetical protein
MTTLPLIPLETGWQCEYFETEPTLYEFYDGKVDVPYLSDWRFERRFNEIWAAWLQRAFTLDPTDFCVQYSLVATSAPAGTRFYLNDRWLGDLTAPFRVDVTDYVFLERNTIALRVAYEAKGAFNGLRLEAVACE